MNWVCKCSRGLYNTGSHSIKIGGEFRTFHNVNFGTMTFVGQTLVCPMHFVFAYNGVTYNLALAPPTWAGDFLHAGDLHRSERGELQSMDGAAGPEYVFC